MTSSTHHQDYRLLLGVLQAARKRQGVSQVELATRLGNTQTFVSKCERGERRIDIVEFIEFAEALGLRPDALITEYLGQRGERRSGRGKASKG